MSCPSVTKMILNNSPGSPRLNVTPAGAQNEILLEGLHFPVFGHTFHGTVLFESPGIAFSDLDGIQIKALDINGCTHELRATFTATGIAFPGTDLNVIVHVVSEIASVQNRRVLACIPTREC